MVRTLVLILSLALPLSAAAGPRAAANRAREGRPERGVGFVLGAISGLGFGYRWFREDGVGWQIGGLAYAGRDDISAILGVQRMHTLRVQRKSRLYALAGAMHSHDRERFDGLVRAPPGAPALFEVRTRTDSSTHFGAGIGMSFGGSEGVCAVVELPLVARFDGSFDLDGISPIPQIALLYNY